VVEDIPVTTPVDVEEEIVDESGEITEIEIEVPAEKEEIIVKTKLSMPSRKLKVKISSELLQELERLQVNFKLN
jgi:DNA polymerase-3 subunit alpha